MGDINLDEGRRAQASFSAVATPHVIFDRRAGDDRDRFMSVDEHEVDLRSGELRAHCGSAFCHDRRPCLPVTICLRCASVLGMRAEISPCRTTFTFTALQHSAGPSVLLVLAIVPTRKIPDDVRHSRKFLMHSGRYLSCETLELTLIFVAEAESFCRTFREPRVMDTTPGCTCTWPTLSDQ